MNTRTLICCGSGGVGKTTTSAALALKAAASGYRTVVLTIDPARRLAGALGIGALGNSPRRVPNAGPLDAMMLDPKQTFDGIVQRLAPSQEVRNRILGNHYYQHVSGSLAGVQEYMAMERLLELVQSQEYEVVVLDTPPTRHALSFMEAPDKMARLMDEGVMRWLTLPSTQGGWRMIERGSEVLARVLEKMLGENTIADIAEFFSAFQSLWEGFRSRSLEVSSLLKSQDTRFLLVATPSPAARADAMDFLRVLREKQLPFAGFILNRCLPAPPTGPFTLPPAPAFTDPALWNELLQDLHALPDRLFPAYTAQEEAIGTLVSGMPPGTYIWRLPDLPPSTIHELQRIEQLSRHLPPPELI